MPKRFWPEELRFNVKAAKGTPLYEYIRKHKCPFYVDRLQGGVIMYDYTFDPDLVKEYERMLGDDFLGFQIPDTRIQMCFARGVARAYGIKLGGGEWLFAKF